jgi:hypothetical protein
MKKELNVLEQTNILHLKGVFSKEECATISEQILNYKDSQPNNPDRVMLDNANYKCWMGQPHFYGGFTKEIENLLIHNFKMACNEYVLSMPKPANITQGKNTGVDLRAWEVWAWANVNEPNSENREHVHTGYFMSGVAYFQAKNTGRIEFMPYNYTYKITHPNWPYYGTSYYEPEDGDIIMFPSYLLHRVERNPSQQQRISMAFNATLPTDDRIIA